MLLFTLLLLPGLASARLALKAQYEEELLRWGLSRAGLELEPSPEGKVVERVVIVREDIIAQSDPWPNLFNWFHVKTRESIVRQEILLRPGQRWDRALVEESARNLRQLFILAVVRAVPCRSPEPGKVVLLVVTKDLWSIRLNTTPQMVGSTLQLMDFFPTEMNFLGRNMQLGLHIRLQQLNLDGFALRDHIAVGQTFVWPRVFGSRLQLSQRFDVVVAGDVPCGGAMGPRDSAQTGLWCPRRGSGDVEGVYGYLLLERPLFALSTRWAYYLYGRVDTKQVRYYTQPGPMLRSAYFGPSERDPTAGHPDGIPRWVPRVYDQESFDVAGGVTRSFGRAVKHDLEGGLRAYRLRYDTPDDFPFDETTRRWFRARYMPRSESAAYLYLSYRSRDTRYARLRNVDSMALTEDFALGHNVLLETRFAAFLDAMDPAYILAKIEARYRWLVAGGLVTATLGATGRYQPELQDNGEVGPWANVQVQASLINVSPLLWIGRLHVHARALLRYNNLDNVTSFLGGGSGLRGYSSQRFEGDNLVGVNVEFRTLPLNFWTLHAGLVAFYDGGAVFDQFGLASSRQSAGSAYRHSVGLGIRALFPQFDKQPLRLDLGFPLSGEADGVGTWFSLSFGQVF